MIEQIKREISGFYQKFNTQVLKYHMNKIFDYEYLLKTANDFPNYKQFYDFHTKNKGEVIDEHVELMLKECKIPKTTEKLVRNSIAVRLYNIYNGMTMETKIINILNQVAPWITCKKTEREIDMNYKVDAVITISSIGNIAIQIKPFSFTYYGLGSETIYHHQYEVEFETQVYYLFYKDADTIIFNSVEVKLDNVEKLVEIITNLGLQ